VAKKRQLRTLADVRRFIASVICRLEESCPDKNLLDAGTAGRLGYLANILAGIIKDSDLEKRIALLEERMTPK